MMQGTTLGTGKGHMAALLVGGKEARGKFQHCLFKRLDVLDDDNGSQGWLLDLEA